MAVSRRTLSALHLTDGKNDRLGVVWITPSGWRYQCSVCNTNDTRGTADMCLAALSVHLETEHQVEAERF